MSQEISTSECKTQWNSAFNTVFSSLLEQYNKDEVAQLEDWQLDFIDENVDILLQAMKAQDLNVDNKLILDRFKDLISRIWPSYGMFGGAGELVLPNKNVQIKNDFKSIVYLMLGILFMILAFIRIDQALKNAVGTDLPQTLEILFTSMKTALAKTSFEQNNVLDYVYYLFFNICKDYVVNQGEAISNNMISIGLHKVLPEFYDVISAKCGFPNLKGVDVRTWSGFLTYANFGASTITNTVTLNSCIVFQSSYWAEYKAKSLPVTIMTDVATIGGLLTTGSLLIVNNLPYIYTRIKELTTNITIKDDNMISRDLSQINNDQLQLDDLTSNMSQMKLEGGIRRRRKTMKRKKTKKLKSSKKSKKRKS